jgi:hypothetical protein
VSRSSTRMIGQLCSLIVDGGLRATTELSICSGIAELCWNRPFSRQLSLSSTAAWTIGDLIKLGQAPPDC